MSNPLRYTDPDGRGPLDKIENAAKQAVNKLARAALTIAVKAVSNAVNSFVIDKVNDVKTAVNNVKTNINSAVTNAVNNVKTTVDKPLISATITTKDSRVTPILDLPLGDKISSENSISKTVGKGNGFINLDITKTIDGNVEGATLSNALGSSVSLSRTGSIGIGQSFGNNELHTSSGIGLGLGEYTFGGSTTTTNGVTNGVDCTFRPGGGAALVSAGAIAIVLSGGTTVPLILAPAEGL